MPGARGNAMPRNLWKGTWRGQSPNGDVHERARNVISRSGAIVRGKFPSRKNGRMVQHEGLLELDAIYLFEASHRIVRYREQPLTLHYPDGARLRRYTPDFELVLDTGEIVLIEVKPFSSLCVPEVQHKLYCITKHLKRIGHSFVILDDRRIRYEPRLSNLRWTYHQAARIPPSYDAASAAITKYSAEFPMSLRAASARLLASKVDPYSLLLSGWLSCSLETPVSLDTLVRLAEETCYVWFWIAEEHGF